MNKEITLKRIPSSKSIINPTRLVNIQIIGKELKLSIANLIISEIEL